MGFDTCPVANVGASVEQVWRLLANPTQYALWWDAQTRTITPEGLAQPGQRISAQTAALGRMWDVDITVQAVVPEKHQIDLLTRLPWGITVYNHIACLALSAGQTRVSFG